MASIQPGRRAGRSREDGTTAPLNLLTAPTDLERSLAAQRRRQADLSPDTLALLEAGDAREVRLFRVIRHFVVALFLIPALLSLAWLLIEVWLLP